MILDKPTWTLTDDLPDVQNGYRDLETEQKENLQTHFPGRKGKAWLKWLEEECERIDNETTGG